MLPRDVNERCNAIEECYEFMLAYAARGLSGDEENKSDGEIRRFLGRAVEAVSGLADAYATAVKEAGLEPANRYDAFLAVLNRDASDSLSTIELVLAQPALSSQLIDNLNASIHVRALLTDIFVMDEILKQRLAAKP